MLLRLAPVLFVLLWSTGFIASKIGSDHAEPFTFLTIRFGMVLMILVPWVVFYIRPHWPTRGQTLSAVVTGLLIHAGYLGGILWSMRLGMPASVGAIIVSTQPVLTALLSGPLLGEWPDRRHLLGLPLGLAGVFLVLSPKLLDAVPGVATWSTAALVAVITALFSITLGTIHQKRHGTGGDLVALTLVQYLAAFVFAVGVAVTTETLEVDWSWRFVLANLYLVLVLSIGAIWLLLIMIRASAVGKVTSLFYIVPATTTVIAALLLDERLSLVQIAGIGLVMAAVYAMRRARLTPSGASRPDGP